MALLISRPKHTLIYSEYGIVQDFIGIGLRLHKSLINIPNIPNIQNPYIGSLPPECSTRSLQYPEYRKFLARRASWPSLMTYTNHCAQPFDSRKNISYCFFFFFIWILSNLFYKIKNNFKINCLPSEVCHPTTRNPLTTASVCRDDLS